MLLFNKQYRIESGIFRCLMKKFAAAQVVSVRNSDNNAIYTLDNSLRISFNMHKNTLTVVDVDTK